MSYSLLWLKDVAKLYEEAAIVKVRIPSLFLYHLVLDEFHLSLQSNAFSNDWDILFAALPLYAIQPLGWLLFQFYVVQILVVLEFVFKVWPLLTELPDFAILAYHFYPDNLLISEGLLEDVVDFYLCLVWVQLPWQVFDIDCVKRNVFLC